MTIKINRYKIKLIFEIVDADGCFVGISSERCVLGASASVFGIGYHCGVRSEIRFAVRRVKASSGSL